MIKEAIKYEFGTSYNIKKSYDGKYIASIGKKVRIFDAHNMKLTFTFSDLKHPSRFAFSNNSKYLVVKNTFGKVSLYDLTAMKLVRSFQPSKKEGADIKFSPDDDYIITADWNGSIFLIDIDSNNINELKSYKNCMVESIDYDKVSEKYFFMIAQKRPDKFTPTAIDDYNILLEWKYPFDSNIMSERKIDCRIWMIRYNRGRDSYVAINNDKLVVYNNQFEVIKSRSMPGIHSQYGLDFSIDGKYIIVLCGNNAEIINYDSFTDIKTFKSEESLFFIEFVEQDDDKNLFCGAFNNGYYLDFAKLIGS